jgi:hypothetical protein
MSNMDSQDNEETTIVLPGGVEQSPARALGFDTDIALSPCTAQALKADSNS